MPNSGRGVVFVWPGLDRKEAPERNKPGFALLEPRPPHVLIVLGLLLIKFNLFAVLEL